MRVTRILTSCTIVAALAAGAAMAQAPKAPAGPGLTLTTPAFPDGGEIPTKFTQAVPTPISPKLEWTHVPANTVSFTLIMHDPDVSREKTTTDQLHWLIFNIPATASGLPENVPFDAQLPDGALQAKNAGGVVGYRGPGAPAVGPHHHYTWELFALDTKLSLPADTTRPDVLKAIDGHILGKGVLVGRFHRP